MSYRLDKINQLLRQEISKILLNKFGEKGILTITEVKTSRDLSLAKVYLSLYSPSTDLSQMISKLNREKEEYRRLLTKILDIKKIPKLKFLEDSSFKKAIRIEEILSKNLL